MALEIKHLQTSCGDPKVVFEHSGNYMIDGDEFSRLRSENAELKQKLEDAKATAYAESVDAGMRERRLKRALYKACANWALSTLAWLDCIDQGEPGKWSEMVRKCRNKVEEYNNG